MAIQQCMTVACKKEMALGTHNFAVAGDVFKIALYTATSSIGPSTTVYSATDEVVGTGYVAGGATLTNVAPVAGTTAAYWGFANASWASSTLTARGALIYNTSKSNKAVAVLDFGADKTSSNSTFLVTMPAATEAASLLRID